MSDAIHWLEMAPDRQRRRFEAKVINAFTAAVAPKIGNIAFWECPERRGLMFGRADIAVDGVESKRPEPLGRLPWQFLDKCCPVDEYDKCSVHEANIEKAVEWLRSKGEPNA